MNLESIMAGSANGSIGSIDLGKDIRLLKNGLCRIDKLGFWLKHLQFKNARRMRDLPHTCAHLG